MKRYCWAPVVVAEVGGIPSLVRNEKEVLLYSAHSAEKWAGKTVSQDGKSEKTVEDI